MDKEGMVYIHNGILLIHKMEHICVNSNEVDEPRTYYTEWSESEREKQTLYMNAGWLLNKLLEFRDALQWSHTTMTTESMCDTERGTQQPEIVTFWLGEGGGASSSTSHSASKPLVQPALGQPHTAHRIPNAPAVFGFCWVGVRI